MRMAAVNRLAGEFPLSLLCRALGVSRSGYRVALATAAFAFLREGQHRRGKQKKTIAADSTGDAPAPPDRAHPLERSLSLVPNPL